MAGEKEIEAIYFLKNKLLNHYFFRKECFGEWRISRSFERRMLGFRAWREGKLTLGEMFRSLLPGCFRSKILRKKIWNCTCEELNQFFSQENLYGAGKVKLFGRDFYPSKERTLFDSWYNLFSVLFQIVIKDQYFANRFLKNDAVVIDAGANIGIFSILAANICLRGKIYSFEPNSKAYEALVKNASSYQNIKKPSTVP